MFNGGFRALHDAVLCIALGARHHNSAFFIISWLCQDVKRGDGNFFLRQMGSGGEKKRERCVPAKSQISPSFSPGDGMDAWKKIWGREEGKCRNE